MTTPGDDTVVIPPMIGDLIGAQLADNRKTTDLLIANLRAQLADRDAQLAAIRWGMERLIYGDYMPTTNALAKALNPTPDVVGRFRRNEETS